MKKCILYTLLSKNTKTYKIIEQIKQSILLCDRSGFEEAFLAAALQTNRKISSSLMIADH